MYIFPNKEINKLFIIIIKGNKDHWVRQYQPGDERIPTSCVRIFHGYFFEIDEIMIFNL